MMKEDSRTPGRRSAGLPRRSSTSYSSERRPLLDATLSDSNYNGLSTQKPRWRSYSPAGYGGVKKDEEDVGSILYHNILENDSRTEHGEGIEGSPYTPKVVNNIEKLQWTEILPYYLPCSSWIGHYSFQYFLGDLFGGLTLVFFQLPLSLSYATSLAHVPISSGLLSLAISPLIYMIFGSVPQMIVGPEAAISLVVGQAVEPLLHHSKDKSIDGLIYVVAITFVSGASLLGFGLARLGYLDNVLNAALLKGFISGVGIVMVINSLVEMLGLSELLRDVSIDPHLRDIHSPFDKVVFLFENFKELHVLTFKISISAFLIIMCIRYSKSIIEKKVKRLNHIGLFPEIMVVVVIVSLLCSYFDWDEKGVEVIGKVKMNNSFKLFNPLSLELIPLVKKLSTSGFMCAMLGFFESTTASKSLGSSFDLPISSNRELVALGFINIVGSSLGALPAFGGYGRSKVNARFAATTMSGAIMGICTLLTFIFFMDWLHYIPKCILSVVSAVIGISLLEEAPYELYFHWTSRGYDELVTFGVTVFATLFFSMETGIALGLVYSLVRMIKHSAESRIQILCRCPGTDVFIDADLSTSKVLQSKASLSTRQEKASELKNASSGMGFFNDKSQTYLNKKILQEIEECLIIQVPEPLTFANASDLRSRLKRVEMYGSAKAHPASKRSRNEHETKYMIFYLYGMTELDSSASQILKSLLKNYRKRNILTFFVKVTDNPEVRDRLERCGIVDILVESLEHISYHQIAAEICSSATSKILASDEYHAYQHSDSSNIFSSYKLDYKSPYFEHISDALKVLEYHERNSTLVSSNHSLSPPDSSAVSIV